MKVKNVNGTSGLSCKCGSWLDHWKRHAGTSAYYCQESLCRNLAEVGAHVQRADGSYDNSWYIVPLCHAHNQTGKSLTLMSSAVLVPARAGPTCGR